MCHHRLWSATRGGNIAPIGRHSALRIARNDQSHEKGKAVFVQARWYPIHRRPSADKHTNTCLATIGDEVAKTCSVPRQPPTCASSRDSEAEVGPPPSPRMPCPSVRTTWRRRHEEKKRPWLGSGAQVEDDHGVAQERRKVRSEGFVRKVGPSRTPHDRNWTNAGAVLVPHWYYTAATVVGSDFYYTGTARHCCALTLLVLRRYCPGTMAVLRRYYVGTEPILCLHNGGTLRQVYWHYAGTESDHRCCLGTALPLHWYCTSIALVLHQYDTGTELAPGNWYWYCCGNAILVRSVQCARVRPPCVTRAATRQPRARSRVSRAGGRTGGRTAPDDEAAAAGRRRSCHSRKRTPDRPPVQHPCN